MEEGMPQRITPIKKPQLKVDKARIEVPNASKPKKTTDFPDWLTLTPDVMKVLNKSGMGIYEAIRLSKSKESFTPEEWKRTRDVQEVLEKRGININKLNPEEKEKALNDALAVIDQEKSGKEAKIPDRVSPSDTKDRE